MSYRKNPYNDATFNLDLIPFNFPSNPERLKEIFSGFGYELYLDEELPFGQYIVLDGEGEWVADFCNSLEAKKWMKEHRTSECWRADGKWDWSREVISC